MIEISNLQKVLDHGLTLEIPSLKVQSGQIAGILGPVDSGKDALFQLLTGELRPTRGEVRLCMLDPNREQQAASRQVGVLFPQDNLYQRLSTLENLRFHSRLRRLPRKRALAVLEQVGLADQVSTPADKLDPGQSRRLALGRAILNQPKVLLLSEPFAGCEQASIQLITNLIRELADTGTAVLIFSADAAGLDLICHCVYRMDQGRISESYDPRQEQAGQQPFMVPARGSDRIVLIDPADILYVFAQDDRTYLQTHEDRLPTQFTLSELEKRLSRSGFFRSHRAYLVNLQQVREVIPFTRNSFSLRLKDADGTQIPLSKSAERELRDLLGY